MDRARGWLILLLLGAISCGEATNEEELRALLSAQSVEALPPKPVQPAALVELGRMLFFDREISGNRDIACATCHHPALGTGDALSVSVGTGGEGLGRHRTLGDDRSFIPRNAPEIYNRGYDGWTTMFWDMRVAGYDGVGLDTPAGEAILEAIDGPLAAQALFPPTSRDEMRGDLGDIDASGARNEIAEFADDDVRAIWAGLTARLLVIDEYVSLFASAYPEVAPEDLTFAHAANAIAAFEVDAFTLPNSRWDRYLRGEVDVLTDRERSGAILFFGKAQCSTCHSGTFLSDQEPHCTAAAQVGPGKGDEAPHDFGRARETDEAEHMYAFRTPPLRNVELTGPYTHSGAYRSLDAAVRYHLDPAGALETYDRGQLTSRFQDMYLDDAELRRMMAGALDPDVFPIELTDEEVYDILQFLLTLTDPAAQELEGLIPERVPSGLPVDR